MNLTKTQLEMSLITSLPKNNRELMRIFRDLDFVEHLGSGMQRILSKYDQSIFKITENFIEICFPFAEGYDEGQESAVKITQKTSEKILNAILSSPQVTIAELAIITEVNTRSVEKNIKNLQNSKKLRRIGPDKGGYWKVQK